MSTEALAGVRVLDLADESAALASRILADLGADVVKVEPPGGGATRRVGPFLDDRPGPERGFFHLYHDAGKRSLVLDRSTREGAATFQRLLERADVLVETASSAALRDPALEPGALRGVNPRLIHATVLPFASQGEWRDWRANDLVAGAASGLVWLCGEAGAPPLQGSARPAYTMASLAVATGVMVGLSDRERSPGRAGVHFEVSLQEAACMATLQTATPTFWSWFGRIPGRPGLSNALRCKDGGFVGLLVRPGRFELFLDWLEEAGVETTLGPGDAHLAEVGAPRRNNPVAAATLELAARYGRDAFSDRAAQAEIVCLPILDFPSMAEHPHFLANEQFLEVEHSPLGRRLGFPRSPVDAMARGIELRRAPLPGEHGKAVLAELEQAGPLPPHGSLAPAEPHGALSGVRVVDFCWVLAGPIGTRLLASHGADVIRIESSRHPDGMRSQPGPDGRPNPDLGGLFHTANAGKRSLAVDLSTERGRDVVRQLISKADVVTNNFRPGALERMGFGYDALREIRPDIILLNLPGTHKKGPWAVRPTMGNVVMAASGFNPLMGFPGGRPRGVGVAYPDFTSPYLLATSVMAALRERAQTGQGQELDLSQLSATISLLGAEWMQYHATGVQPPPASNRDPDHAPHGVFATRGDDEWIAIAVRSDEEWQRLAEAMGLPELARDPRFASHGARKRHEDSLDGILTRWTRTEDRWELAERLQGAGVPAAPVEHLRDTLERDPQLRDHYESVRSAGAEGTVIPVDRECLRFAAPHSPVRRAPLQGEHNEAILRDLLGLSDEAYTELVLAEVLV